MDELNHEMKSDSQPSRFCLKCGYSLHALPDNRCPECGREFDPDNPKTYATSKRWRIWRFLRLAATHPFLLLVIGWLIHLHVQNPNSFHVWRFSPTPWLISIAMIILGIVYLFWRRWSGLTLILLCPACFYIAIATYGYFTGTGQYLWTGKYLQLPGEIELNSRLPYAQYPRPTIKGDHFEIPCNNLTIQTLGKWFGRAPGTWDGPIPSKEDATSIINSQGQPFDLHEFLQNRLTLQEKTITLDPGTVPATLIAYPNQCSVIYQIYALPELVDEETTPVAALVDNQCILLRIHLMLKEKLIVSEDPSICNYEPYPYTVDDYTIYLIDTDTGIVFARY